MAFACIYVPDFLLQAVVRGEFALSGRALALLEGVPPLCRVVAANKAAIRAGIELGMAKAQAEQFGGAVEIRRRSPEQERNAHAALLDLAGSFSPRVEDTAPESILLDLAGLEPLFGDDESVARGLAQGARDVCRLEARVAVASNPETALHAARGLREPGFVVIPAGEEAARLGPLPIGVLGASAEALETLERWGVRTCAALAALPVLELSERLGAEGVRLHQWARGAEQRALVPAEPALCFEEALDLDYEVTELEPLAFLLSRLLEALCARLAARSLAASALQLRLKLARHGGQAAVHEKRLRLPVPLRNAKLLLNLLRLQLQGDPPGAPVCGVLLAAEPARPRVTQGGFFTPAGPDPETLELTLARLAHLVGESRVGSPELMDTHRPDAFRMRRFLPAENTGGRSSKTARLQQKTQSSGQQSPGRPELQKGGTTPRAGFRLFRSGLAARVEMRAGRPARVFFRELRGEVLAASGPWRGCGDWWTTDAWQQDEWDLEIRFAAAGRGPQRGLYRFAYDPARDIWLVRGVFD